MKKNINKNLSVFACFGTEVHDYISKQSLAVICFKF